MTMVHPAGPGTALPTMSIAHSPGFWLRVALPTWGKGVIIRRRRVVALAERLDLDARAVRYMERLHRAYGGRSALVRNPIRTQALVLDPADVAAVLHGTPAPFTSASDEKRAALGHFEPDTSLVTRGAERAPRRRLSERALETPAPVHSQADRFRMVIAEEVQVLLASSRASGELAWPAFAEAWSRIVRRIVLGDLARDDQAVSDLMERLRRRANWAFARPRDRSARDDLHARLRAYVERGQPGSLVARLTGVPEASAATHQVTQWLFAFDPAGMTAFRALALIAADAEALALVNAGSEPAFLRACILETLRLFPTTPAILRQTTEATTLGTGGLPEGAGVLIYAPFFHRASWVPDADRFRPRSWIGRDAEDALPLVPFSAGQASCPAKNLVPFLAAEALRELITCSRLSVLHPAWLNGPPPLRGTLDNYAIRLRLDA